MSVSHAVVLGDMFLYYKEFGILLFIVILYNGSDSVSVLYLVVEMLYHTITQQKQHFYYVTGFETIKNPSFDINTYNQDQGNVRTLHFIQVWFYESVTSNHFFLCSDCQISRKLKYKM